MKRQGGYIHIYTGKGKGKTTASLGLAMRAVGWGMRVCVFQFMKSGVNGEQRTSSLLGGRLKVVTFDQTHPMFYHKSVKNKAGRRLKERISRDLKVVRETLLIGNYDIVILDEVINAIKARYIKKGEALSLLNPRFRRSELILTGRGAPQWLIKKGDYVTDMRLVKHPYKKGLRARKGIEY